MEHEASQTVSLVVVKESVCEYGLKWVWSVCFETSEWRRDGLECMMMKGMKRGE